MLLSSSLGGDNNSLVEGKMKKSFPPAQITKPETFIIESLNLEDEKRGQFDGRLLYDTLKLQGEKPLYYYFRTVKELEFLAVEFRNSGYRYLHLSCHGGENVIAMTLENINYMKFSELFEGKLNNETAT